MSARDRRELERGPEREHPETEHLETEHLESAGIPLHRAAASGLDGAARHGSLGIQFAGTIVLFGALGYWADRSFDTLPWFMLTGLVLGSVGGFVSLVKKVPGPRRRGARPESRKDSDTDPSASR